MSKKYFIGTSGWAYSNWGDGWFYPKGLPQKEQFEFYAKKFSTVEINYTFYRQPNDSTLKKWVEQAPPGFQYAIKAHRYLTHIKRLQKVSDSWKKQKKVAEKLKKNLGPILVQCPPNLKKDMKRLESFGKEVEKSRLRIAMEFRHKSWIDPEVERFLKKKKWAWVISSMPQFPLHRKVTADFAYIRFHGRKKMFHSSYSNRELKDWAQWMKNQKADIYAYFNNDAEGHAPKNAAKLLEWVPA